MLQFRDLNIVRTVSYKSQNDDQSEKYIKWNICCDPLNGNKSIGKI